MHKYVTGPATLKTMMPMLVDVLDIGDRLVYPDATEARVCFQQDVTIDHTDTIMDHHSWHQLSTIDHREDFEELIFPQLFES